MSSRSSFTFAARIGLLFAGNLNTAWPSIALSPAGPR